MGKLDPSPVVAQALALHSHTLIMLHGRGSNATRFAYDTSDPEKFGLLQSRNSMGKTLQEQFPGLKVIFPQAPLRRCTARRRTKMNIWFDSASFEDPSVCEELHISGICENTRLIKDIIWTEAEIVGLDKVFLGGLSEGCAMAVYSLMGMEQNKTHLAGFIGLSGWLPFQARINQILLEEQDLGFEDGEWPFGTETKIGQSKEVLEEENNPAVQVVTFMREEILEAKFQMKDLEMLRSVPVFIGHGEDDDIVPLALGLKLVDTLQALGLQIQQHIYPDAGHWYKVPAELDDIAVFLESCMRDGVT